MAKKKKGTPRYKRLVKEQIEKEQKKHDDALKAEESREQTIKRMKELEDLKDRMAWDIARNPLPPRTEKKKKKKAIYRPNREASTPSKKYKKGGSVGSSVKTYSKGGYVEGK